MKVLIRKARIFNPGSTHHQQVHDILVVNGIIKTIGTVEEKADKVIEGNSLYLSTGFLDLRSFSQEPGNESMETLESLAKAAAAGGFTQAVIMPNTKPVIQTKESVSYFRNFSKNSLTQLLPAAAVTKECKGEDFTEMWDLYHSGAVAFTDGSKPLWNADIFLKTLQYLYPKNALLINRPEEVTLSVFGQMHEGVQSTLMGTKGIPAEAEEIMVMRDLKLLEYTEYRNTKPLLHFSCISSDAALKHIRKAKQKGLPVSCDVAAHQLTFTDESLSGFDTNLKVSPPFRSTRDLKALKKGLEDGTIDAIVTDHHPLDEERKNLEFDLADFGVIGLQTAFLAALTFSGITIEHLIPLFTDNPRKILGLELPKIEEGVTANLTLIEANTESVFEKKDILSLSKNSPYIGKTLKGKILAVFNNKISSVYA
jgi:dihydroorotase